MRTVGGTRRWAALAVVGVLLVVGLLSWRFALTAEAPSADRAPSASSASPEGEVLYASPSGGGEACSSSAPCQLTRAVESAPSGSRVLLQGGQYADQEVTRRQPGAEPVVIEPAPGARPVLSRVTSNGPGLVWQDLTVTVIFYVYGERTELRSMHFDGAGLFVRGTGVAVRNSLFENGSSIDGIQVSRARDVLVEGNTVRDYDQSGTSGLHSDCIQLFDSDDVTIRGNALANCYNAGIIFSGGSGLGMSGIVVEANFIQGCVVKDESCRGGAALDAREPSATGVVIRSNTILNGSTRIAPNPGWVFDRNIVEYLNCDAPMTNTIVQGWNRGLCEEPDALGRDGNVQREVTFVDVDDGDLHVVDPADAGIQPWGAIATAEADIDGQPLDASQAGADAPAD